MRRGRRCAHLVGVLLTGLLWTTAVLAQHAPVDGAAPPPPPGDGVLTVRIVHPTGPAEVADLQVALYALSPDGTPGYAGGRTDAQGVFTFRGISTDPDIVYLVGAHYRDIPFGERVTFAPGTSTANVELEVGEPTEATDDVAVDELRLRIDWMGDHVLLREIVRVENAGERVVRLPGGDDPRSIWVRPLAPGATDFAPGPGSIGDGIALEGRNVRFWGPLYPGDQRIEYRYQLPIESGARRLTLPLELEQAAERVVVVAGTSGIEVEGPGFIASSEVQSDSGQTLEAWARSGLSPGEVVRLAVTLPESRRDASLLSIPRSDVWLELDDARMTATVDIQMEVEPGAPVSGTPEAPLLRIELPEGAVMQGVAPEAESLGLIPRPDGGFDVIGPVRAGVTSLGYSYHMPTGTGGVELGLRFPRDVGTLNVLIADTGLALDSSRLHRRRPFRSGTRNYLHREAFNVAAGETVDLSLEPLRATGLSQPTSLALTVAAAAAGIFFLFAPLRRTAGPETREETPETRLRADREAVYAAIRDLDHDFETAKLDEGDYRSMREALRARAIELLRLEREGAVPPRADASGSQASAAGAATATPPVAPQAGSPTTGTFCPHCGQTVTPSWRFCSHCGGGLNPPAEAEG